MPASWLAPLSRSVCAAVKACALLFFSLILTDTVHADNLRPFDRSRWGLDGKGRQGSDDRDGPGDAGQAFGWGMGGQGGGQGGQWLFGFGQWVQNGSDRGESGNNDPNSTGQGAGQGVRNPPILNVVDRSVNDGKDRWGHDEKNVLGHKDSYLSGPSGTEGCGQNHEVGTVPEINPGSLASALTLLGGGTVLLAGRKRRP